jgi:cytochrome P450
MITAVLVVVGVVYLLIALLKGKKTCSDNIPAVPGGYPFLGHVLSMLKGSPWDVMTRWAMKYGTIYRFHLFGTDGISVADPELLKIVLQTKISAFKKDVEWTYKPFMVLLGQGIVTAEGKSWLRQRTLLATHLKNDILEEVPDMALRAVNRLRIKLDAARDSGKVVEMAEEFRHLTLQVIAEAILSLSPEESDQSFATMYLPIVEESNLRVWHPHREFIPSPAWFKFKRDVAKLNDYVVGLIKKRWALREQEKESVNKGNDRKKDILDKILSSIPKEEWNDEAIEVVRDQIKTFVLAGHETSASMLSWALYELNMPQNKPYLEKVIEESNQVFDKKQCRDQNNNNRVIEVPSLDALASLEFAECALKESLRKYSVVPTVVRKAAEDVQLGEYTVYKGATIMVLMQGVHHNPQIWPNPLSYQPQRFEKIKNKETGAIEDPVKPYTFIPFVEGPRMCLGQYLSLLEAKIVLSILVDTYRFELQTPEESGEKHPYMIPIIPKTGHFMKIYNRR